ncbi:MAG: methyltransferase domain-containing protein [Candidatus Aminicenantes bacterium]|nr:methyltransferase domain-containing protein [Candidatus Aminicenantes bacterium]
MNLLKRDPNRDEDKIYPAKNQKRLYPDSRVELTPFIQKFYDVQLDTATLGLYKIFIQKVIKSMDIQPADSILDFGCGTGRNACLMAEYLKPEGKITGLDISEIMQKQFEKKCRSRPHIQFKRQRIDRPFNLQEKYDKVFMSFVLHGFPQEIRKIILENALTHLKTGGTLNILDYSEFEIRSIPFHHRFFFNLVEGQCKYAFDFIQRDWRKILSEYHFNKIEEIFFIKNYIRLLRAERSNSSKKSHTLVVIPSNDGITIFPKMLGMAKYMYIYAIEKGEKFRFIEKRTNPYENTLQHLKTLDVYELIGACDIILAASIGKKGIERLKERGLQLFFKKGNIQEALTSLIEKEKIY